MGIMGQKILRNTSTQKLWFVIIVSAVALLPTLGRAATTMEPGLWEVTVKTSGMMGMPSRNMITKQCIKPEDLKKPEDFSPDMSGTGMSCTKHNVMESGNTVTWQITCKSSDMTMEGTGSFVTKSLQAYEGQTTMKMKIAGLDEVDGMLGVTQEINTSYSGRRLGSCK